MMIETFYVVGTNGMPDLLMHHMPWGWVYEQIFI